MIEYTHTGIDTSLIHICVIYIYVELKFDNKHIARSLPQS